MWEVLLRSGCAIRGKRGGGGGAIFVFMCVCVCVCVVIDFVALLLALPARYFGVSESKWLDLLMGWLMV